MYLFIFFKYFTIYELKQLFFFIIFNLKHSKTLKKKNNKQTLPRTPIFTILVLNFKGLIILLKLILQSFPDVTFRSYNL